MEQAFIYPTYLNTDSVTDDVVKFHKMNICLFYEEEKILGSPGVIVQVFKATGQLVD